MKYFITFIAMAYLSGLFYAEIYRLNPRLSLNAHLRFIFLLGLSLLITFAFFFLNKL